HVGDRAGSIEGDRGRAAKYVVHDDECRTDDHCRERDEQGRDTDRQRHQSPPRFFARGGRTRLGRPRLSPGPRPEVCYEPDLPSIRAPPATPRRFNDEIVMIMASWQLTATGSARG